MYIKLLDGRAGWRFLCSDRSPSAVRAQLCAAARVRGSGCAFARSALRL